MDARQWIEPGGVSFDLLPPWAQIPYIGHDVVVQWPGYLQNSQPPAQGFVPDVIGPQWGIDVQSHLDQWIGVVNTLPSSSHADYDVERDTITSMTPTFDIRRSLNRIIPQRRYANNRSIRSVRGFKPGPSISFNTCYGRGYSVRDALDRNSEALVGREDPMLPYCTSISLRFEFEGYEPWTQQVKTRDSRRNPKPIPREKLGFEVAKRFMAFLKAKRPTVEASGDDTILDTLDLKDIVLVRLDHVSKASWQPQFMIVRDA